MTPQELKESILFLAAQGKLVPQLEPEGVAQDIINTISSQRASLEIKGHLKKRKTLPEISEDEIPFDIPESWVWVRVYDLADVCEKPFADGPFGSNLKSEHYTNSQEVRIIQLSNIGENGWKDQNVKYTTFEHLKTIQRSEVTPGDIVVAKMMPAGRAIIVPEGESKYVLSSDAVKFVVHPILDKMYLYYVINSQAFRNQVYSEVQGITRVRTSLQKLIKYLLPLPPLAEQKRIVAKIEELLQYIDRYEKAWSKLEDFNKRFPGDMQKSILQMAIQGKLVEQRPEDGTGEELYQQIQAEKQILIKAGTLKKEKLLPEITDDEKPFDIPESWKWARVGSITIQKPKNDISNDLDVAFIPMRDVTDGFRNQHTFEIKKWNEIKKGFTHFADGDIGVAKITPCFQNRKSVVFRGLKNGYGAGTTELSVVRVVKNTLVGEYLLWFFKTNYFISNGVKSFSGTAGQQRIHKDYISTCPIPVPPLAEQKRIVAKLVKLLPLCEKLNR